MPTTSGVPQFRSMLFVPADRGARVAGAPKFGPDCVIVDLEDAVSPDRKAEARKAAGVALGGYRIPFFVRVNAVGTPWFADDIRFAGEVGASGVVLPKLEDPEVVRTTSELLNGGPVEIVPLIETAAGVQHAFTIFAASPRVKRFIFGAYDYLRDMNVERSADGVELSYARGALAVAGRAARCQAIDSPLASLRDDVALRLDCIQGRRLGFSGKGAIHPEQISTIHDVFSPQPSEVARARRIVDAFDAAGTGVISFEGEMLDKAVVDRYRSLLEFARTR